MPEPKANILMPAPPQESAEEIEARKKRELIARVRSVRTSVVQKVGEVRGVDGGPPPADKHYAWINSHPARITWFKAMGYEICKDPRITTDYFDASSGTHLFADCTLMYCDKDFYEALKLDNAYRAMEGTEGASAFTAFAGRVGIPVSTPNH